MPLVSPLRLRLWSVALIVPLQPFLELVLLPLPKYKNDKRTYRHHLSNEARLAWAISHQMQESPVAPQRLAAFYPLRHKTV